MHTVAAEKQRMMKTICIIFAFFTGACALTVTDVTGPTAPPVPCPHSMCAGLSDGNHNYNHPSDGAKENYFLQCVDGRAYCQACWPLTLKFKPECNQCMYKMSDPCYTTKSWEPVPTYSCPNDCPGKGPNFQGNIVDLNQPKHYIACWNGVTVGCVNCPSGLEFNEEENACLYEGKYLTRPS